MKIFNLILVMYFLFHINCEIKLGGCYESYNYNEKNEMVDFSPKSSDDCKNRLTESQKKDGDKCCYEYGSKAKEKGECRLLDKYEYENIGKLIKISKLYEEIYKDDPESKKEYEEYGDSHIDCFSEYIKISLISIILILF